MRLKWLLVCLLRLLQSPDQYHVLAIVEAHGGGLLEAPQVRQLQGLLRLGQRLPPDGVARRDVAEHLVPGQGHVDGSVGRRAPRP